MPIAQVAPFRLSDYIGQGVQDASGMFRLSEAMQNAPLQRQALQQNVALGQEQVKQAPLQTEALRLQIQRQKQSEMLDSAFSLFNKYQSDVQNGKKPEEALAEIEPLNKQIYQDFVSKGYIDPQQMPYHPWNPADAQTKIMSNPQTLKMYSDWQNIKDKNLTPFQKELSAFQKMKPGDPGYEDMRKRIAKETAPPATTLTPTDLTNAKQMAHMIANYQVPPLSGFVMKSPYGQMVMSQVLEENPNYSAPEYHSRASAVTKFASGPQGNTVRSFNVAIQHLDLLGQLTDALQNGNVKQINRLANSYAEQTGQPAPTNFDAAKQVVLQEVIKAVSGSAGALGDREEAAANISRANSPQAIKGAINTYIGLMGGQLKGLKKQYEDATKLTNFNDKLAPETVKKLETSTPTSQAGSDIQNLLDKYAPVK